MRISKRNKSVTIEKEEVGWILLATLILGMIIGLPIDPKSVNYPQDTSMSERKVGATKSEKAYNKYLADHYAKVGFGYNKKERECLVKLWTLESRFDNYARPKTATGKLRSTAFGIGQHLGERSSDPATQILRGLRYIEKHRIYKGSACRALQFHRLHGWY